MRNSHPRYMCYPSVVLVGRETEVIIKPRDISRVFREDKEYELRIIGMREDMPNYLEPNIEPHNFTVSDGCLCFKQRF